MTNYKPSVNFYRRVLPDICIDFSSYKGQQVFKVDIVVHASVCVQID